ncbi:ParB/RepB/Spo0J family partition protein [Undibacterium arcticum]
MKQASASQDRFARADITMAIAASKGDPDHIATPLVPRTESSHVETPRLPAADGESRLRTLEIAKVKDHPRNARKLYDPSRIDSMAKTIARDGQKVPVIVMADASEPGTYLLLEGRYRKRSLLSLGRTTILTLEVDELDDLEAYRLSLLLNEERNDQTDLDNALSWKEMLDDKVFTSQRHICEQLGLSEANVSKNLGVT